MADLTPIPMGIQWDPWEPSLPHSHAHLYICPVAISYDSLPKGYFYEILIENKWVLTVLRRYLNCLNEDEFRTLFRPISN